MSDYKKIHQSEYGGTPLNFHVEKRDDTLEVTLTYPPWTNADNENEQCRYIHVDQESVRASDGVRLHYDYERDGFVVEQPRPRWVKIGEDYYDCQYDWIETGFFQSWQFDENNNWAGPTLEQMEAADAEFERKSVSSSPAPAPSSTEWRRIRHETRNPDLRPGPRGRTGDLVGYACGKYRAYRDERREISRALPPQTRCERARNLGSARSTG